MALICPYQKRKCTECEFYAFDKSENKYACFKEFVSPIPVVRGDIFNNDAQVILHQVNCQGVMGSGVAKQVREKYPFVYKAYKDKCDRQKKAGSTSELLGEILACYKTKSYTQNLIDNQVIVNLFSQDNYGHGRCYTNYKALEKCLKNVNNTFSGCEIAIPYRMSCVRGGGDWHIVDRIIYHTLKDCNVTYYSL